MSLRAIIDVPGESITVTPYCYSVELLIDQTPVPPCSDNRPLGGRAKISLTAEQADDLVRHIQWARTQIQDRPQRVR